MILTFLLAGLTRKIALQGVKVKKDIRTRSGHSLALGSLSLLKIIADPVIDLVSRHAQIWSRLHIYM